jgi:hypothetical protein
LSVAGRRHPDVGQHHVRLTSVDGGEQLGEIDAWRKLVL